MDLERVAKAADVVLRSLGVAVQLMRYVVGQAVTPPCQKSKVTVVLVSYG